VKKILPYILLMIILGGIIMLIVSDSSEKRQRRYFNHRISLRKEHKIPYGLYVAYHSLSRLFPFASVYGSRQAPGRWDSISALEKNQALIIITDRFSPDEEEMKKLVDFAAAGNFIFISARSLSYSAESVFHCSVFEKADWWTEDSLNVQLENPPFHLPLRFSYPGMQFSSFLEDYDTLITGVMGKNDYNRAVFTHYRTGEGSIYLHLAPLAFSNYFLLHKENVRYYENVISLIPRHVTSVVWDEYYMNKPLSVWNESGEENQKRRNWWSVMMSIPALKAALWTGIVTLLIYLLLGMRRKQRVIPVMEKPKNDSLDFVKTIGRLYFDKNDHADLCIKMSTYFLEHVRSRYRLATSNLNGEFVKALHYKSGYPEQELGQIISFIQQLTAGRQVSDEQLAAYYKKLESFYKNT